MDLNGFLSEKKSTIVKRWIEVALKSYPAGTGFLKNHKHRFTNPVGYTLHQGIETIFEGLLHDIHTEAVKSALDGIVRVTAVQGLSPSESVGFLFRLKEVIRETLGEKTAAFPGDLLALDVRIDALALLAFDIFMECREKIYELKASEARNMTFRLLQRAKIITNDQTE